MHRLAAALAVVLALPACASKPAAVDEAAVVTYLRGQPPEARQRIASQAAGRTPITGVTARAGTPLTLLGPTLEVGAKVPAVTLVDPTMAPVPLVDGGGHLTVVSVVPSLDTPVCEAQTHHVSDAIAQFPPGTRVITVSRDLPFAQKRFADEAQTQTLLGSDYRGGSFGAAFGLEVAESGLLARSVWVIASDGTVAYRELVPDQTAEPDYAALTAAVAAAR